MEKKIRKHHDVVTHIIYHRTNRYKSTPYKGEETLEGEELPSITRYPYYAIFERSIEKHYREGHSVTFMIS